MKTYLFITFLLCLWMPLNGQVKLSEEAKISVLTSSPFEGEVYTLYGHAGIRVNDPVQKIDFVFNYGIFDFSKPNFIYRFAKGETDYKLGGTAFRDYVIEYEMRGSEVVEQVLNLQPDEKERIWQALVVNLQPENQVYRYNFFFDNCATRPIVLIEKQLSGTIGYAPVSKQQTFRDLINHCTRNHAWLTFGCDLALGSPTDQIATPYQTLFLPMYLKEAFAVASIVDPDGSTRPLVAQTNRITTVEPEEEGSRDGFFTPLVCAILLFVLVAGSTVVEWRMKTHFRIVDCILFLLAGLGGVILFFLSFVSVHPCTFPNWSLIWLQPLDLVAVVLFSVKKLKKAAYCYHFINFAALTLMLVGWHFIPQHLNIAFIPLVLSLWLRSGYGVYRKIWKIG